MFRGRYEHTVDPKGRTSLPSRFREILADRSDDRLIVTTAIDAPCLIAYPFAEWQRFEERLMALPQFDPAVVKLKRVYVSSAMECSVDRNGRILIPPVLREHAGIGLADSGDHEELTPADAPASPSGKVKDFSRKSLMQASTTSTSYSAPLSSSISARATSMPSAARYGRCEAIASTVSATARTLASMQTSSPESPLG